MTVHHCAASCCNHHLRCHLLLTLVGDAAAWNGHVEVVTYLLRKGANVGAQNHEHG